jgi:hypothetical protein
LFAKADQPEPSLKRKYKAGDAAEQPASALKTKLLPAILLACSCWLLYYIAPFGVASGYYFKANYYLELWQRKPKTLDSHSWQEAANAIQQAVERHPNHPHYLLSQAKINEWAWYAGFKTPDQIAVNDQLYKQAIQLRPNWPNAYADYAYYLGVINFRVTEAFDQLAKARQTGPFMPETFQRTLLIAATHWPLLNVSQKAIGLQALEQMVKNSYATYRQAIQISQDTKLQRQFCIYLRVKKAQFLPGTQKQIEKDFCKN